MLWIALALACRKDPPAAGALVPAPAEDPAAPPGCKADAECAPGEVCEGPGCSDDRPGVCVAALRPCTRDLRPWCGCDGETFLASGSCPGRRFAQPGPCEGAPGTE